MTTRCLKKWLQLPRSSTRVILYYPGVCCPSISTISREAKLNLLSCVSASSDLQLQELGVHLRLGQDFLQVQNSDYSLLLAAKKQLSALPSARSLYLRAKHLLSNDTKSACVDHLHTLRTQLSWKQPVEPGTDCYLVSIQASYPLF